MVALAVTSGSNMCLIRDLHASCTVLDAGNESGSLRMVHSILGMFESSNGIEPQTCELVEKMYDELGNET